MKATLDQWRMFKAVVDHGGYAQAAEAIYKSQSTISYAVHKLQEMLGVQLLEIDGRKAVLTEHGKILLQRATHILDQVDGLGEYAKLLSQGVEAKIRLAIEMIYPYERLFQVLEDFSQQYPNTRIELEEYVLNGGVEMLEEGSIDLLISAIIPAGYAGKHIYNTRFVPVCARNHPLMALNHVITYEDLANHRQVVLRDSSRKNRIDVGWLGANQRWTVTHSSTSLEIIRHGLGFAWLPEHWISDDLATGSLKIIPIEPNNIRNADLYLIEAHPKSNGPATNYLAKLLAETGSTPTTVMFN